MTKLTILVLGATGPAGICLLRELVYRKHQVVVYARSPSKIPDDLAASPLIEVIKGEMNDSSALSTAVAKSTCVISLLGPNIQDRNVSPTAFSDMYKTLFPLMRQHGVRRIFAMGTISIQRPEDSWSFFHVMVKGFMRLFASSVYRSILNVEMVFERDAADLDWTVFRIAQIPGGSDEQSWKAGREKGRLFTGWVGDKGWTSSVERAGLARWLADAAEGEVEDWIRKMPAVSWHS